MGILTKKTVVACCCFVLVCQSGSQLVGTCLVFWASTSCWMGGAWGWGGHFNTSPRSSRVSVTTPTSGRSLGSLLFHQRGFLPGRTQSGVTLRLGILIRIRPSPKTRTLHLEGTWVFFFFPHPRASQWKDSSRTLIHIRLITVTPFHPVAPRLASCCLLLLFLPLSKFDPRQQTKLKSLKSFWRFH